MYNYHNLVLYLCSKGINIYEKDHIGQTCFHVCASYGRLECINLILNYERFKLRKSLLEKLNRDKHYFKFNKSHIQHGENKHPDAH